VVTKSVDCESGVHIVEENDEDSVCESYVTSIMPKESEKE
jgi:hypothetical protein